jgi:predicted nucleotidyltransferase
MKKKIFGILKKAIESFENLDKIELIATFGSITKFENSSFDDLDVIIISDKKSHDDFISHLKKEFIAENFEPIVFETITKKPKKEKENQVFIHDLHYRNLSDLIEKEWKSVVNSMKSEMVVLHGDKNFPEKLPFSKISKEELLNNIIKWSQKIKSKEEFEIFQNYLLKIIPKLLQDYDYLDLTNLKEIQKLLNQKFSWSKKLEKVKDLIAQI